MATWGVQADADSERIVSYTLTNGLTRTFFGLGDKDVKFSRTRNLKSCLGKKQTTLPKFKTKNAPSPPKEMMEI